MTDAIRAAGMAVAVGTAAALALVSGISAPLERHVADTWVRLAARRPPAVPAGAPDVAVVAIDPPSLRANPVWPWPRRLHGQALARLDAAGAKVVAFDIDFSTPRDPDDDRAFADAIAHAGRVALAAFRQVTPLPGGAELEVANLPCDPLGGAAAGIGSVLVPVDPDGVVRRVPVASSIGGEDVASLAAVAVALARGDRTPAARAESMPVDYRRAAPAFPVIPIGDVLEGRFDPRDVAGRIVLVGATAAEFQDLWNTPLGPAQPGVMIQALAVRTLLARGAGEPVLASASQPAQVGVVFAVSALAAVAGLGSHRRRVAGLAALGGAVVATSLAAVTVTGRLVDPALPLLAIGAHYVLGLETLQRRFGHRLAERDLSLSALFRVGEISVRGGANGSIEIALALLGDVTGARSMSLLRASSPKGGAPVLDGTRIEWRRSATDANDAPIGDGDAALRVLAERRIRIFQGALPGTEPRSGLAVYVPLFARDAAVGVLVVERDDTRDLDDTQLRTIATVGTQIALSAENLRLLEGLRATFDASVSAIATAIEARDGYTEAHCRRLAAYSAVMADRLGLPDEEVEAVRLGALLHDVGKIGIRDTILLKPGSFTAEERCEMQRHPDIGHRIIGRIEGFHPTTLACVRHHHERWDGSGYPDGLRGEAIPLGARIVSVVDVWDALSTDRPYKKALSAAVVRDLLDKGAGAQFDPALVDLFYRILAENELEIPLGEPA